MPTWPNSTLTRLSLVELADFFSAFKTKVMSTLAELYNASLDYIRLLIFLVKAVSIRGNEFYSNFFHFYGFYH